MSNNPLSDEFIRLQKRVAQLEHIEREYLGLKQLIEAAANNQCLENFGGKAILYVDAKTQQIQDVNPQAALLLGYSADELRTRRLRDIEITTKEDDTRISVATYTQNASEEQVYLCLFRHRDELAVPVRVHRRLLNFKQDGTLWQLTMEELSLRKRLWTELTRREDQGFQFREKLKYLNEINVELGNAQSLHELCQLAITLGMQKLGFDRLSIWFHDETTELMSGTYGVDEHGVIRDERDVRWSYTDTYVTELMSGTSDHFVIHEKAPIFNHRSQIIGDGWHISVPLLHMGKPIGFMTADNFINQQPMKEYQPELLRLYGITLGHLTAHQRQRDTVRKLSDAIQNSNSMVAVLDEQGAVEFVNAAFTRISGYNSDVLIGKPLAFLMPEAAYPAIWQTISSGVSWRGELRQVKSSGATYETICSISPVFTLENTHSYVVVQEDISELKATRKQQFELHLEQERNTMLKGFIGNIGHEFRNPLSVISLKSYLLHKIDDEAQRGALVEEVQQQVRMVGSMIENMIYIVKLETDTVLNKSGVDPKTLVENIVQHLAPMTREKRVTLQLRLSTVPATIGDAEKLNRAVTEVIRNAVQYSRPDSNVTISLSALGNQLCIQVADTGIGIAEDALDKIFNRLYRVDRTQSNRGTGLGLSIARLIVEAHGGTITVESVLNQGSVFEIWLPATIPTIPALVVEPAAIASILVS
jgi:PAS domain S-box-containing protein